MNIFTFARQTARFLGVLAVLLLAGYVFQLMNREQSADTPAPAPAGPVVTRSINYADPGMQRALKDELAHAGIPFSAQVKQGKEFISWRPEDNPAVEKIQLTLVAAPSPSDRSVHFDNFARQQAFKEWLVKRGIEYHVTNLHGREFVVWKEGPKELALQFVKEQHDPCPEPTAARDKAKKKAPAGC